jgi:hypothetical protein
VIDHAHAAHLASDRLEHPRGEAVDVTQRGKGGEEPERGILELYEYGREYLLVVLVPREQNPGEFVQTLDPCYSVVVQLDLGACDFLTPAFLIEM